jgi:excisionase family DNA binding protein
MTTTKTDIEPLVYDLGEVARALRIGLSTVRNLVASGDLKSVKIGDRRLVTREALSAFLGERAAA